MRTAKPLVTCRRMTLLGPSSTWLSNSRPRLIGPGDMTRLIGTNASFLRCARTERVTHDDVGLWGLLRGVYGRRWCIAKDVC